MKVCLYKDIDSYSQNFVYSNPKHKQINDHQFAHKLWVYVYNRKEYGILLHATT